jgi:glycosyltransferase involved in cell wall biosynthesis
MSPATRAVATGLLAPDVARRACSAPAALPISMSYSGANPVLDDASSEGARARMFLSPSAVRSLSVVVPVYRSEATLSPLAERLAEVLPGLAREFELILVNDGSPDDSWSVIETLSHRYGWVRGIRLMRNYGQHNALLCGVRAARFEIVVTMDDDLQHPPEEITRLLDRLDESTDVVYGAPSHQQHGLARDLASMVTKLVLGGVMGVESAANVSAFRAFRRDLRRAFRQYQNSYVSIDVLLTWATTRFAVVRVRHDERQLGASNYSFRMLVRHALNMVTGFSTLPLRFASMVGFAFTAFGIGVLSYVLLRYFLLGGSIPGFPFVASIIAIFSGAQLFSLGIIGEYLARMHTRMQERPTYVVRGETSEEAGPEGQP